MREWIQKIQGFPPVAFIINNASWIIVSLILAIIIWVVVTLEENPIEQRTYPETLEVTFIEGDDVAYVQNSTTSTRRQVVIRAPRSSWEVLKAEDIEVIADLRNLEPGIHDVILEARIVDDNLRARVVDIVPEDTITVEMQVFKEIILNVTPIVQTEPPRDYTYPPPVCSPSQVVVSGAEDLVNQVARAVVRLRLQNATAPIIIPQGVIIQNGEGRSVSSVRIEPENVVCEVNIQPRDNTVLRVEPDWVGEPGNDYIFESARANPPEIYVTGDPDLIASMEGVVQTEPVNITGRTGDFSTPVELILPEGLTLDPPGQTVRVTISIEPRLDSVTFTDLPVQINNLQPGLSPSLNPETVSVVAFGPIPLIRDMTPEDFIVYVDAENLQAGLYTNLPLQVEAVREELQIVEFTVQPLGGVDVTLEVLETPQAETTPAPESLPDE